MKRCIVLVILACVLFVSTGIAESSEESVLRNGITWGMSPEDVAKAEGTALTEYLLVGENMYYSLEGEVCGAKVLIVYFFDQQQLFSYCYMIIDEMNKEVVSEYIEASLRYKYGIPKMFENSILDYFVNRIVGIPMEITSWPLSSFYEDGTYIIPEFDEAGAVFYIDIDYLYNTDGL